MAEKRKALTPLNILPKEIRIIFLITTESSAKRKKTLIQPPPPKLKKHLFQPYNWQNIPAKYYTTTQTQKKFRKFGFKTSGAS